MFHVCIFSGSETSIPPGGFTSITLFGSTELRLPTLADRLVRWRNREARETSFWGWLSGADRGLILSVFASTELIRPTILEEFAALRSLLETRAIDARELPDLLEDLLREGSHDDWTTLSLFAGCTVEQPERDVEMQAIHAAHRAGMFDDKIRSALRSLVGTPHGAAARALGRIAAGA
jgi:hypothetical protein